MKQSEPLRRTQSARTTSSQESSNLPEYHTPHHPPPLNAPRLMLVNGSGEVSSLPSPIVGGLTDDESSSSDVDTPVQVNSNHVTTLAVPSQFDSPFNPTSTPKRRDYSPVLSPGNRPVSPPKRSLSPSKMILANSEGKPRPNHRRGHKHRHSLSHQIFLPPPERPPLPLPSNLPIPTITEFFSQAKSSSKHTTLIVIHVVFLIHLLRTSTGESALVALSFLALNDLVASVAELFLRTMHSFDVWQMGTLQFPFGLQRIESLASFGVGVLSTFNGLYILKETIEDIIISFGTENVIVEAGAGPAAHLHHHHYVEANPQRLSPGGIDVSVLCVFLATVALLAGLAPHAKSSRLLKVRIDYLTPLSCFVIFMIPLLGVPPLHSVDRGIAIAIAFSMVGLGLAMGKSWGSILLCMSSKDEIPLIRQISSCGGILGVDECRIFQATPRFGVVMLTIRISGFEEAEKQIREHIGRCITDWDKTGTWECFVDFKR